MKRRKSKKIIRHGGLFFDQEFYEFQTYECFSEVFFRIGKSSIEPFYFQLPYPSRSTFFGSGPEIEESTDRKDETFHFFDFLSVVFDPDFLTRTSSSD